MKYIIIALMFVGKVALLNAQQILLDEPLKAAELILFRSLSNPSEYYYLPDKPRLAKHSNSEPQFSFIRYVKNEALSDIDDKGIRESEMGGGIVHALVELSVSDKQKSNAENALKRIKGDAKIVGPVIYKSGTIALITSVAKTDGGMAEQVVGLGNAPILENQKSAVSIQLNKVGAKLLWEMFTQTTTPDISFSFEMEIEGFLAPKSVIIEADFEEIYKHQLIDAALTSEVFAAEINASFDELFNSGAIKVTQVGHDEDLNKLKETAYSQLIDLMFNKVGGTGVADLAAANAEGQNSMLDRATEMLEKARIEARNENDKITALQNKEREREQNVKEAARKRSEELRSKAEEKPIILPVGKQKASNKNEETTEGDSEDASVEIPDKVKVPGIAVGVSYTLKKTKQSGKYKIDLNKYTETSRSIRFDENVFGGIRNACQDCFVEINLDDPLMKQREILVSLGLTNIDDFSHVNYVNVIMKKKHQNGGETLDEIRIDRTRFSETANLSRMIYGWKGDENRNEWLTYHYNVFWSFSGGHEVEIGWQPTIQSAIALEPPIIRKPIYIAVDEDFVYKENVRAVEVRLFSKLGDKVQTEVVSLSTQKEEFSKNVDILLPRDVEYYEYEIVYSIKGSDPVSSPKISAKARRIDIDKIIHNN